MPAIIAFVILFFLSTLFFARLYIDGGLKNIPPNQSATQERVAKEENDR